MRKPTIKEFENDDGVIDFDAFEEAMGDYEDEAYQQWKDEQFERHNDDNSE